MEHRGLDDLMLIFGRTGGDPLDANHHRWFGLLAGEESYRRKDVIQGSWWSVLSVRRLVGLPKY